MLKLLKNKNFTLLFLGNFTSQIGSTFYNFAVGWFILTLTASPLTAGLYIALGSVIQLLMAPLAGVFADRFNKVRILYMTDYIRGIAVLAGGLIIFTLNQDTYLLLLLYAVTVILAINNAFFIASVSAVRPLLVKDEELNQANAFFSLIASIQTIIGVLLAGSLYVLLGIELIFIINGVSFILSAISEMFIRCPVATAARETTTKQSYFKDFKEALIYIKTKTGLMPFMLSVLFLNFAAAPLFVNALPYLFNLRLEKTPIHLSVVHVTFAIGMLLGGIIVGSLGQRIMIKRSIKQGLAVMSIGLLTIMILMVAVVRGMMPYPLFLSLFLIVWFFTAISQMWLNIPFNTGIVRAVVPEIRGRVFSVMDTITQGLVPLGIIMAGAVLEYRSIEMLFVILTLVFICPFIVLMYGRRVNLLLEGL